MSAKGEQRTSRHYSNRLVGRGLVDCATLADRLIFTKKGQHLCELRHIEMQRGQYTIRIRSAICAMRGSNEHATPSRNADGSDCYPLNNCSSSNICRI